MLERADLVKRRRIGREHVLSANPQPLDAVASWLAEHHASWTARLAALDGLLRTEDPKHSRKRRRGRP